VLRAIVGLTVVCEPAPVADVVLSHPDITSTLIGARSVEHVDQAIAAQAMGMSPELRANLSAS
jgi:aryl-alcohol dehydrogenase-like predicted oxidoreductase